MQKPCSENISSITVYPEHWAESFCKKAVFSMEVTGIPDESSLLRLVSALLSEISTEWLTGKIYLNMNPADLPLN